MNHNDTSASSLTALFAPRRCAGVLVENVQIHDRGALLRDGFTKNFPPGIMSFVVAPNGSGKSTLLAALAGLLTPASGRIKIMGDGSTIKNPDDPLARAALVAWLPPEDDFPLAQDPVDVVLAGRWRFHHGKPSNVDGQAALACMMATGLPANLEVASSQLSSGQKRRLNLARVLCQDADIILLDEPFRGLDETGHIKIATLLDWLAGAGRTIIIADPRQIALPPP